MSEPSKSETVQVTRDVVEVENVVIPPKNSQKYSRDTWIKLKSEFQAGTYLSLKSLAKKYGVNPITLNTRMNREKWNEQQRTLQNKVEAVIEKKIIKEVSEADSYLKNAFLRAKKYERLLDKSIEQVGEIVEPSDLDCYTRSELRIHELAKSSLRIAPISQVDITSKGQGLGESFASAIEKLRQSNTPKLSDSDLSRVLEAEVE